MNKIKITLNSLILLFIAANFTTSGMDNPKYNALITRPFAFEKPEYTPKIELLKGKNIGYGDIDCINTLNEAGFKADYNSPVIPFKITVAPNIAEIATQQALREKLEMTNILREELNTDPHNIQKHEEIGSKVKVFCKRLDLMKKSALKLEETPNLPWPSLIPIKYLNSNGNIKLNLYNGLHVDLEFNNCQKLERIKKEFEEKPTTTFFQIPQALANRLNASNEDTPEEEKDLIDMEILEHIEPKKADLRAKKIVNRRPHHYNDMQTLPHKTLPRSNIMSHRSNYYTHGANGYSAKRERDEFVGNLNGNAFNFLNDRENGFKKRKLDTSYTLSEQDLLDVTKVEYKS